MDGFETDTQFIRDLCEFAELKPSALAKRAGLAATTITRAFNGEALTRISQPTLTKLRAAFPDYPGFRNGLSQTGTALRLLPHHEEPREELAYVREVDISYAMGDGAEIEEYPETGLIPFNLGFLRGITRATTDRLFVARGHGESMEPTLLRSDVLMIDTSQNRIGPQDQVWALTYAGGGMIKRLRRILTEDGERMIIMSDNPIVPPQTAMPEDVHIIGKVVWVGRRM